MSKGGGKKGGHQVKGDVRAISEHEKDQWVEYLEKELREQQRTMSEAGARSLDERINDARRVNELKLAICAEEWRRGLAHGGGKSRALSGKQKKGEEDDFRRGGDCHRDLAAMITQRGCEIAILAISEQARRKQAEKVILQGLVFGLLITAAIALIVLVSGLLEAEEDREKSPVITKVAILSRDGSKAGVFLELHHNLDDMEGVRSDVAMFIQRNFPHVVHDKQMWNGLMTGVPKTMSGADLACGGGMTEAKKALKAVKGGSGEGDDGAPTSEETRQIALVISEHSSTPFESPHIEQQKEGAGGSSSSSSSGSSSGSSSSGSSSSSSGSGGRKSGSTKGQREPFVGTTWTSRLGYAMHLAARRVLVGDDGDV